MIVGALVLPPGMTGKTEASTTRRPSMPAHPQLGVEHRVGAAHAAGARRVVEQLEVAADEVLDVGVVAHARARVDLAPGGGLQRLGVDELPRELDAGDERREVLRLGQASW